MYNEMFCSKTVRWTCFLSAVTKQSSSVKPMCDNSVYKLWSKVLASNQCVIILCTNCEVMFMIPFMISQSSNSNQLPKYNTNILYSYWLCIYYPCSHCILLAYIMHLYLRCWLWVAYIMHLYLRCWLWAAYIMHLYLRCW